MNSSIEEKNRRVMKMINAIDPYSSLYVPSQRTASKELDKNAFCFCS